MKKPKKRRPNPLGKKGFQKYLDKQADLMQDAAFGAMLGRVLFPALFPGLGRKVFDSLKPGSTLKLVEIECACGGTCFCHTGLQLAGVPCPLDCPNYGNHLDGCHRCDCKPGAQTQPTGNDQTTGRVSEDTESPNKRK